jgi:basic amino acid/polyamine antiporter, APA family
MGLTTIGALALAMLFAALSRRLPADGGPYAYSRVGYGNAVGFANAWSYWVDLAGIHRTPPEGLAVEV